MKLSELKAKVMMMSTKDDQFNDRNEIVELIVRLRRKLESNNQWSAARCAGLAELRAMEYEWSSCLAQLHHLSASIRPGKPF